MIVTRYEYEKFFVYANNNKNDFFEELIKTIHQIKL